MLKYITHVTSDYLFRTELALNTTLVEKLFL